ncbi:HI0074 family nucleotidyltransferase substrate-binding subunit [Roseateles sp.]|uniref:HI0074 family nucleotidyltransferase substrate-binding subunit n=1 Tax=Roseateles sp. TaxID=1971397 RepID=UPI00286CD288|nr:HI0074 family nucleotidyltransferase substrate-binding subunit [Roseateles sp.]
MANQEDKLHFQLGLFSASLLALREAVETDTGDKKSRDSILLSYVFTFEMAWKTLKAALLLRGADAPDYAAGTLRSAFTAGLLSGPDLWMDLREGRNEVSHAYDQERAIILAAMVKARAVQAFEDLLKTLQHDGS